MALVASGVYPVHNNVFQVKISNTYTDIKGMENFAPSFDNTIEEWNQMDNEGWGSSLLTGKKWGLTLSGKRIIGDPGNDYLAGKLMAMGQDAYVDFKWVLPSGASIEQQMTISVTNVGGGDTTNVAGLEASLTSNGKPTFTAAS